MSTYYVLGTILGNRDLLVNKTDKGPALVELHSNQGFPGNSDGKESACNAGDLDSISE